MGMILYGRQCWQRQVRGCNADFTVTHVLGKQPAATAIYLQGKIKTAKLTIDPLYIDSRPTIYNH
jgi:hypothetical protein